MQYCLVGWLLAYLFASLIGCLLACLQSSNVPVHIVTNINFFDADMNEQGEHGDQMDEENVVGGQQIVMPAQAAMEAQAMPTQAMHKQCQHKKLLCDVVIVLQLIITK
jgi:hypothetical protein